MLSWLDVDVVVVAVAVVVVVAGVVDVVLRLSCNCYRCGNCTEPFGMSIAVCKALHLHRIRRTWLQL
eukprot:11509508-Karenia_brevis.AAC.1